MIYWQEPPPYVQFMTEAEDLGRFGFVAGVCTRMRLVEADPVAASAVGDDFQRRAIVARVWGPMVQQALQNGADQERRDFRVLADIPDTLPADEARRRAGHLEDYLVDRCGWILRTYPEAVSLPPEG